MYACFVVIYVWRNKFWVLFVLHALIFLLKISRKNVGRLDSLYFLFNICTIMFCAFLLCQVLFEPFCHVALKPDAGCFGCTIFYQPGFQRKPGYCNAEAGGVRVCGRASTFGFRSITLVCFGLLTPNLLYG